MREYRLQASLWKCIRKNPLIAILMLVSIIACAVIAVLPPLILGEIVDALAKGQAADGSLIARYVLLLILASLLEALQQGLIALFGQKITHTLRSQMAQKLNVLPSGFFISHEAGDTVSLFTNDVDTVEDLFDEGIISMFSDALSIISIMVVVFQKARGLGYLLCIALPLLFLMTRKFQKNMLKAQKENRAAVGRTSRILPETLRNGRTIRVYHLHDWMFRRYSQSIEESFRATDRSNLYDSIYSPIVIEVSAVITGLMMLASAKGGNMQSLFGMSAGTAVAVIAYVGKVFTPLESIGMEIQNIQSAAAGISRITAFMNTEERPLTEDQQADFAKPALELTDVSFGYAQDQPVLQDFSMRLESGENASLIGRTGCGKSTIFRLLNGLYEPQTGSVRVYGMDPVCFNEKDRQIMATVEQSFHPVEGTIRDQISLNDPAISEEQVKEALKLCGLQDVIDKLPQGMDTPYSSSLFSQGQQQLLSIARAVVRKPRIMLLDEITASLDSATEEQVMNALQKAGENRTVLSISHRLYEKHGGRRIPVGRDAESLLKD